MTHTFNKLKIFGPTGVAIAKGDVASRENTVQLGIKESLSQRGIQADSQTG